MEGGFGGGQPCGLAAAPGTGLPPAFGGRQPHKIPPTRTQKLFAPKYYKRDILSAHALWGGGAEGQLPPKKKICARRW